MKRPIGSLKFSIALFLIILLQQLEIELHSYIIENFENSFVYTINNLWAYAFTLYNIFLSYQIIFIYNINFYFMMCI